jgi:hypothetical protein
LPRRLEISRDRGDGVSSGYALGRLLLLLWCQRWRSSERLPGGPGAADAEWRGFDGSAKA